MKLFNKRILLLCVYITVCLFVKAVVYEPFAQVDYSLPSDETYGRIYNEDMQNILYAGNQNTIGGGRAYYCPTCGMALHPDDHTELDSKGTGNAYIYTGRKHYCGYPLNGEYILLLFALFLLLSRLFINLINKCLCIK